MTFTIGELDYELFMKYIDQINSSRKCRSFRYNIISQGVINSKQRQTWNYISAKSSTVFLCSLEAFCILLTIKGNDPNEAKYPENIFHCEICSRSNTKKQFLCHTDTQHFLSLRTVTKIYSFFSAYILLNILLQINILLQSVAAQNEVWNPKPRAICHIKLQIPHKVLVKQ